MEIRQHFGWYNKHVIQCACFCTVYMPTVLCACACTVCVCLYCVHVPVLCACAYTVCLCLYGLGACTVCLCLYGLGACTVCLCLYGLGACTVCLCLYCVFVLVILLRTANLLRYSKHLYFRPICLPFIRNCNRHFCSALFLPLFICMLYFLHTQIDTCVYVSKKLLFGDSVR